jgi:hypothetical protein
LTLTSSTPGIFIEIVGPRSVTYQPLMDTLVLGRAYIRYDIENSTSEIGIKKDLIEL